MRNYFVSQNYRNRRGGFYIRPFHYPKILRARFLFCVAWRFYNKQTPLFLSDKNKGVLLCDKIRKNMRPKS